MTNSTLAKIQGLITAYSQSRAVQVMADLGLADRIARGSDSLEQLAAETGLDSHNLERFLRYLAALDLLEHQGGRYSLTEMGDLLRSDASNSQYNSARLHSHFFPIYTGLQGVLRTNIAAYDTQYGTSIFKHMTDNAELDGIYNGAMEQLHAGVNTAILDAYDFSGIDRLLDVGGGNGSLMCAILDRYPDLDGAIFDQPHVVEQTEMILARAGLKARCQTIGGSFFEAVPEGYQTILMRNILHDWPDAEATKILANCRKAVGKGGRILIVETLGGTEGMQVYELRRDIAMMAIHAGEERSEAAFAPIFEDAGVKMVRTVPTASPFSVIEVEATQ